jgi:apolipoprotein N-acyltransferase
MRYISILLLGTSLVWAFPPHAMSYAVFISMTVFLLGLHSKVTRSSFWYGYNFYLGAVIAFIGYWFSYYFRVQLGTGYILSYVLTSVICFYTAFYIGCISFLYDKLRTANNFFNLVVLFPSLWVLTELIRGLFFPRSWYVLGNTQVDNPIFLGYYPVFGVYFVSWLIVAVAGLLTYFIVYQRKCPTALIKGLCLITVAIIFSYFLGQVRYTHKYGTPITVALLQPSIFSTSNLTEAKLIETENIVEQLIKNTDASLIILPETIFGTDIHYLSIGYLDRLRELTKGKHVIFGSPVNWPGQLHQTGVASLDNPNQLVYIKHYLVPFGEYIPLKSNPIMASLVNSIGFQISNYIPGIYIQQPLLLGGQKFAFNICYENTVNDFVAKNAALATILINQSDLSWYGKTVMKDASLQFSQARALENQRYFLQDGNTGETVVINPMGKIEQQIPAFEVGSITTNIQGYSGHTPFEYMGNIPIWLLCFISIFLAVYKRIIRRIITILFAL